MTPKRSHAPRPSSGKPKKAKQSASGRARAASRTSKPKRRSNHRDRDRDPPITMSDGSVPWAVTPEAIAVLTDTQLKNLMRDLLLAEAGRANADRAKVVVNTEEKAGDEGCDAVSPGSSTSTWLSPHATCWQLKAGVAGQPGRLKGEIRKAIPAKILKGGGRFVLVASGAKGGKSSIDARLTVLRKDAKNGRLPRKHIDVLTSESLAIWVNEFPGVATARRQMPGFMTLGEWQMDPRHQESWVDTPDTKAKLEQIRRDLDPASGTVVHLHVYGRPGVGKTRLVLEACSRAQWANAVIYLPQANPTRVHDLLTAAARAPHTQVVLVVDELPQEDVVNLALPARVASSRIRVISIGHDGSPDGASIPEVSVLPLDGQTVERVVKGWHPSMPPEHLTYVAQFADGYLRLARLAADALAKAPTINTADLFARGDVRQLMERMLGNERQRRALHVVAVLSSVGWNGERAAEGEAIAKHLELSWTDVRATVQDLQNRLGIAPMAGDLRYISPIPLGVYLALEAWALYPEKLRALPGLLSEVGRRAFNERLRAISASPQARPFAEEELNRFFRWDHWVDSAAAARWSSLVGAAPTAAAKAVRQALEQATIEERRTISERARRELVNGLVDLAWHTESFHDAVFSLYLLAEAENEAWANNATGEFAARFQLFLGGTSAPYRDRLSVIDEILTRDDPASGALALGALMKIGDTYASRSGRSTPAAAPQSREWQPTTGEEYRACVLAAFERLQVLASRSGIEQELMKTVGRVDNLLRDRSVRDAVASFARATVEHYPSLRDSVRREVARLADTERRYRKSMPEDDIAWIDNLHHELEDRSPLGQFRQALSETDPGRREEALMPIARMVMDDPSILWSQWPWVTSGQLATGWDFGVALARLDTERRLLTAMIDATPRGPELRVISGYIFENARAQGPGWVDDWLDEIERTRPEDVQLLFDATWRCSPTDRGAARLERLAIAGKLSDEMIGHLTFSAWSRGPSLEAFRELVEVLARTPRLRPHVLALIEQRIDADATVLNDLRQVALVVATDIDIIQAGQMTEYHWSRLASRLVADHPTAIAEAIFAAHASRGDHPWFVVHSAAAGVLGTAAAADPSGVWKSLKPYLEDPQKAALFAVGFVEGLLNDLPHEPILEWVTEAPKLRGSLVAEMAGKDTRDTSIGPKVIERFGHLEEVGQAFFSAYFSGSWTGSPAEHWKQLASEMRAVADKTGIRGLKRWARLAAADLDRMAARDRKREEEERVRWPH